MPRTHVIVARYNAPSSAVGKTASIAITTAGGHANVRWAKVAGAAQYGVFATVNGMSSFAQVDARTPSLTVPAATGAKVTATVQAERADGLMGAVVLGPLAAPPPPKKHHHHHHRHH